MAYRTAEELTNETASILGKLVVGETLGQVEHDTIDGCIDQVLEEIDGIVAITDRNEIPVKYFETLARLMAVHAASKFSNSPLDLAAVEQHEKRLRYLVANTPTYEVARGEYY